MGKAGGRLGGAEAEIMNADETPGQARLRGVIGHRSDDEAPFGGGVAGVLRLAGQRLPGHGQQQGQSQHQSPVETFVHSGNPPGASFVFFFISTFFRAFLPMPKRCWKNAYRSSISAK